MSSLANLYRVIKNAHKRPKGILVSTEMWNLLKKAGVLEMKTGYNWGIFRASDTFPFFQGDISVLVNPALDAEKKDFMVPQSALVSDVRVGAQERRRPNDRRKGSRRGGEKRSDD